MVAFLNAEGGDLFIRIQDNGNVCGVHDADDTSKRLSSLIHDTILPDVSPFISLRIVTLEERRVVRASVMVGTERPYYLAGIDLKPGDVYTRLGNACVPMNERGIRSLLLETSGTSLYHAKARGSIFRKEVEDLFGLKTTKAFRLLKELCAEGQLTQQTCGKFTRYIPFGE